RWNRHRDRVLPGRLRGRADPRRPRPADDVGHRQRAGGYLALGGDQPRWWWLMTRVVRTTARRWRLWWAGDQGRISAFVVTVLMAILAMTGLTLDGGLALADKVHANDQAEAAARAGAQ